jgi:hypothetical protein
MKNQLFKTTIDPEVLWIFLKENCEEEEGYYIFNKSLYKKAVFRDTITPFTRQLNVYYYDSKKHYVTRKMDYIKFTTILRQLCNSIDVNYETQLVYNNSTYEIVYYIYLPALHVDPLHVDPLHVDPLHVDPLHVDPLPVDK